MKRSKTNQRPAGAADPLRDLPKLSEVMIRFAKPLLDQLPQPPAIEELQQVMTIVTVAWNLPVYEQRKNRHAGPFRATFDEAMARMPTEIAHILTAMLDSRLTTYATDPRVGFVEVVEERNGHAKVVATAALLED